MDKTINTELTTDDPAEIKRLIDQYLEAMRRMDEQRAQDWEEISRLKAETRAMLDILREAA